MNRVLVIAEHRQGRLMNVSLELMGKAAELAGRLNTKADAVLLGDGVEDLAAELTHWGADRVFLEQDPRLGLYQTELCVSVVAELVRLEQPGVVLAGATSLAQDMVARLAARLRTGLVAHCVDVAVDEAGGRLVALVPGWGGSMMVRIVCPDRRPQMVTVKPGVMRKGVRSESACGSVVPIEFELDPRPASETLEMTEEGPSDRTLEDAGVVVAGGWGVSATGGFEPVEDLARVLGGVVAGTRPAVDQGWVPESRLIGQSGTTVSPRLFVSVGASGAPQFTSGFSNSRVILAIDRNPGAPIFECADIGLVGDLRDLLPCLQTELEALDRRL